MRRRAFGGLAVAAVAVTAGGATFTWAPAPTSADVRPALSFEPNRGQTDDRVAFLARGRGHTLFLTRREAVLAFPSAAVRMRVVGAAGSAPRGDAALRGRVNYLRGSDPRRWVTDVPTFGRVVYHDVYPGIDLAYYGRHRGFEYDFILAPRADPTPITIAFNGARRISLDGRGDLRFDLPGGELRQIRPFAYQVIGGKRRHVSARYVLDHARVRLKIGNYDRSRRLVIDPQLVYSTYLGGHGYDLGADVAADARGNTYVTGYAVSDDFPTTPGTPQEADPDPGEFDAFVTKLDRHGNLVYSTYLGGSGLDLPRAIAVDRAGSAYVAGTTNTSDFPTTAGAYQAADPDAGSAEAFLTKLHPSGAALVFGTYLGGTGVEVGHDLALDPDGRVYLTGSTTGGFPTTPGSFQPTDPDPGGQDSFVAEINAAGSALLYSTYLGGAGRDQAQSIALGDGGTAYVAGFTESTSFPTTPDVVSPTDPDPTDSDVFVAKLAPGGANLVYSTYLGGHGSDNASAVAVAAGVAYVAGHSDADDFPTTAGGFQPADPDPFGFDGFVTALNADGSSLVYSTYLGGEDAEFAWDLDARNGRAFVTGTTYSANFPTTRKSFQSSDPDAGDADAFLTALSRDGSSVAYSTYLGGTKYDNAFGVAVDSSRDAHVVGQTASTDFPTRRGAFTTDPDPATVDVFVTRLKLKLTSPKR